MTNFKTTLQLHQNLNNLRDSDRGLADELLSQLDHGQPLSPHQLHWLVKLENRASKKCRRARK